MKKASTLAALLTGIQSLSAQEDSGNITQLIEEKFKPIADFWGGLVFYEIPIGSWNIPLILIILLGGATFFTLYFGFPQFKLFKTAIKVVAGKYDDIDRHSSMPVAGDPTPTKGNDIPETIKVEGEHIGEVSHFQALSAALSATVGLGNIAGVAVAIAIGGPGATFWMILAGLLGMASKFTECTLGVKYRDIGPDGTVYGGPMYYLRKGLAKMGKGSLGKFLAAFFAVMVIGGSFGGGNMFQANQSAAQFKKLFGLGGDTGFYFGILLAILVGVVIIGGIKRIGKVAEKIVPFMAVIYVGAGLVILALNFNLIPDAFLLIFKGAFTPEAGLGGFIGVMIQGFRRATFSNEAGVGSAAIAHSAVKTKYPASEGIVALLEPFIDTVVICTMTALVLIVTNLKYDLFSYGDPAVKGKGVELTATAFDMVIPHFSIILTIAVILFAFSTMLSWSYYGLQGWMYLFGRSKKADLTYKFLFLFFVVVGASVKLGSVLDFSDAMIFAMVFPNIIGIVLLAPEVKEELKKYLNVIKRKESSS